MSTANYPTIKTQEEIDIQINEEKKKIKVTVKIFGRKTPVELGFGEVERE